MAWATPTTAASTNTSWPKHHGILEVLGPSGKRSQLQRLEAIGLDRMVVCPAYMKSLDWTRLRSLKIVECGDLDSLWASLSSRYSKSKNRIDILRLTSITTDAVSAAFFHFIRETLHRDRLVDLTLYPSASSTAVYDFHVSVLKRHAESLQRLTVDVEKDDLRKKWEFTPKMISYILSKMMRLTEVSIPVHANGWNILHRDIRASNLRRLAITIDFGSKGPYQMAEEVKTAITGSAAPLQIITIARKKFEILEVLLPDDDVSAVTSPMSENSFDGKCLVLKEVND